METLIFVKTIAYLMAAGGVFNLGIINKKYSLALIAISIQFFIRSSLSFFQFTNPVTYTDINTWVGTPSIFIITFFIYANLWKVRKE